MRALFDGCTGCEAFTAGCDLVQQYRDARLEVHSLADKTARTLLTNAAVLDRVNKGVASTDLPVVVNRLDLGNVATDSREAAKKIYDDTSTEFNLNLAAITTTAAQVALCPQRSAS